MPQESAENPARDGSSKETTAGADAARRSSGGRGDRLFLSVLTVVGSFADGLEDRRRCSARLLGFCAGKGGDAL